MKKYLSRKFIICLVGVLSGVAVYLTDMGDIKCAIIGFSIAAACCIAYMVIEGAIDAKNVGGLFDNITSLLKSIGVPKVAVDVTEKAGDLLEDVAEEMEKTDDNQ